MNEVINSIIKRRSVKKFKDEMIPRETLEKILVAGTYAPTGMNRQSPIMVCITNKEIRDRLSKLNASIMGRDGIDPFYGAPVVVVVLADTLVRTYKYDGSLVMGNLMLAADSLGIGSCWIHRAKEEFETEEGKQILKDLGIEGEYEGIGNCILGYIDGDYPEVRPRKDGYVYFED